MKFLSNLFFTVGGLAIILGTMMQIVLMAVMGIAWLIIGFLCLKAHNKIAARNIVEINKNIEKITGKNTSDTQTKLTELKNLLDNGLITEDEYTEKKKEYLSTM
jgi:uncharacterized membrane protein YciS (DUF1049 family)